MNETDIPPAIYRTPWGHADFVKNVAPGIWSVETPSHGGYYVDRERRLLMPEPLRIDDGWFEEDCEWARVALAFPEIPKFTPPILMAAKDTMLSFGAEDYAEWLKLPGSQELDDKIEAYRAANGKLLRQGSMSGGGDGCVWWFGSIDHSIEVVIKSKEFIHGLPHGPISLDELKKFVASTEGSSITVKKGDS